MVVSENSLTMFSDTMVKVIYSIFSSHFSNEESEVTQQHQDLNFLLSEAKAFLFPALSKQSWSRGWKLFDSIPAQSASAWSSFVIFCRQL